MARFQQSSHVTILEQCKIYCCECECNPPMPFLRHIATHLCWYEGNMAGIFRDDTLDRGEG